MKFSARFYGLVTILGIVFLALVLLVAYLDTISSLGILGGVLVFLSFARFGWVLVLFGIAFFTVGICGIERHCFKRYGKLLSEFSTVFVPLLTFITFIFAHTLLLVSGPMYPIMSEITQVTVVDTSPLVLSVGVRAITSFDSRLEGALILDDNEIVAQIPSEEEWADRDFYPVTLAELPAGSEISLTLDFNTTLPSGDYLVRLTRWKSNHGSCPFTIP